MNIKDPFCLLKPFSGIPAFVFVAVTAMITAAILFGCTETPAKEKSAVIWSKDFAVIGSQSSPRTTDLNKDGTLDIVMGAGKNEFQQTDMGILAFDGKSGELLWKQQAPDQVYGSASFCDVTGD